MAAIKLYTGRVGQNPKNEVDITVKSGKIGAVLAPTWELVGGYKRYADLQKVAESGGELQEDEQWVKFEPLSDEQYKAQYLDLLRSRWGTHKTELNNLFNHIRGKKEIVIACYCPPGEFCHRHIAVEPLIAMAARFGITLDYRGEYKAHAIEHNQAVDAASELVELIRPACRRIEVAGSVRRTKEFSGDIELVVIPDGQKWHDLTDDLLNRGVFRVGFKKSSSSFKAAWGEKQRKVIYTTSGGVEVKVDMYVADENNFGYIYWLRTGPAEQNTELMYWIAENRLAIRFRDGYCWHGNRKLRLPEEDDLFGVLGIESIPPAERSRERLLAALNAEAHQWPDFSRWEIDPLAEFRPLSKKDWQYVRMTHEQRLAAPERPLMNGQPVFGIPGWVYDDNELEWWYHYFILTHYIHCFPVPGHPLTLDEYARQTYTSRLQSVRENKSGDKARVEIMALELLLSLT